MQDESADNVLLLSDILKFSENTASSGSYSFHSKNSTIYAVETGGIMFAVFPVLTVPPETESFLKSNSVFNPPDFFDSDNDFNSDDDSDDDFDDNSDDDFDDNSDDDFAFYRLSSGSLIFSSRYSQIPDNIYSSDGSSVLLIQEDGFSFVKPPSIFVRKYDGKFLISMSGDIIRSSSSPVFGDLTILNYKVVQKAEVYDFATTICIYFVPPVSNSFSNLNEAIELQTENAFKKWILEFESDLNRNFPELKTESDIDNLMIMISSDSGFEIDITVREIEYIIS
ncbi:hypothetical protein [Methanimicrococcus hongohii]|nr:hypothetical protein [Methanimicrococcus sp. Hf6]